jgi:hypothetical protein
MYNAHSGYFFSQPKDEQEAGSERSLEYWGNTECSDDMNPKRKTYISKYVLYTEVQFAPLQTKAPKRFYDYTLP